MALPYSEGSLFLVPLRDMGYARGVVGRATKTGKVVFGFFFGPRLSSPSSITEDELIPNRSILCARFGDLGWINGKWPIHSKVSKWNRSEWSMPEFVRREPISNKAWRVRYRDDDPNKIEDVSAADFDAELEPDRMCGHGAIEIRLTKLLKS
jgi:immunity protein 26 of polymorphic toxin system